MLARVQIEHELDQGALQSRSGASETDKSTATEFRCPFQVEQLQPGSDGNVIERISDFRFLISNFYAGANPRRMVFSATTRGSRN